MATERIDNLTKNANPALVDYVVGIDSSELDPEKQTVLMELTNLLALYKANLALSAAEVSVVDVGGYFTGSDSEAVLQEIGAELEDHETRISDNEANISTNISDISDLDTDKLAKSDPTVNAEVKTFKVNETTDSASTRGEGTLKYNSTAKRFEGSDGLYWVPVGSGLDKKGFNYDNPNMEVNIDGYTTYKDAAQDTPEDGTGGTPNVVFVNAETITPIIGDRSLKIIKSGVNGQGEGVSYNFTLDLGQRSKELAFSFQYDVGINYDADDMGFYIYDVDNDNLIYPSLVEMPDTYGNIATFKCVWGATSSENYRAIWHVRTTNALAYNVTIDNIQIGEFARAIGDVGRWGDPVYEDYTNISDVILEVEDGLYRVLIGRNNDVDRYTAIIEVNKNITINSAPWDYTANVTYNSSSNTWNTANASYGVQRIEKWIEAKNINLVSDHEEYASNSSSTDADDTTSFVYGVEGSSGIIGTTNITSGRRKRVEYRQAIQPTDKFFFEVAESGSNTYVRNYSTTAGLPIVGDYIYRDTNGGISIVPVDEYHVDVLFWETPFGESTTRWSAVDLAGIKWHLVKVSNGNMAEEPRMVRAEYTKSAAQTIVAGSIINYDSLIEDTHSAVTTGLSWKFTAPMEGVYNINTTGVTDSRAWPTGQQLEIAVYKNGILHRILSIKSGNSFTGYIGWDGFGSIRLNKDDYIDFRINYTGSNFPCSTSAAYLRATIERIGH